MERNQANLCCRTLSHDRHVVGISKPEPVSGGATDGAPMSASQLDALVAPIALYPDALVAQILAASTFPDQVAVANYWLHENQQFTDRR